MTQVFVPRESVNDQTVLVQRVLVANGSTVKVGDIVVEIETSKTAIEVEAPEAGVVLHQLKTEQEIEVGALLFTVGEAAPAAAPARAATSPAVMLTPPVATSAEAVPNPELPPVPPSATPALLSRAAEAAAARLGISLDAFEGRWVTVADIERGRPAETKAEAKIESRLMAQSVSVASPPALPTVAHEVRSNSMRKRAEIDNLTRGQHADTGSTIGIRVTLPGGRIVAPDFLFSDSISDLVIFEGARLLRQFPELNAFNIDGKRAGLYSEVNFGVSFDNVAALKVLTLHGADKLTLAQLHKSFSELLDLYESNAPIPAALLGSSTVTISDLSTTGASFMIPLINGQQSLILGVVKRSATQFEIFATFDHRVTEGLRVTRFLEALRERIVSHYRDAQGHARLCCSACSKTMQDETRLGNRGMLNITMPSGETSLLCRNCFEGL